MTFREMLQKEHPERVNPGYLGGCFLCPKCYGYAPMEDPCYQDHVAGQIDANSACAACWDREIKTEDKPKKSVYIAGPITGVTHYWEQFETEMDNVEAAGYIPLSPTWQPKGLSNAQYMRMCLAMIDSADAVLFLPGWHRSTGSILEMTYCQYTDKPYSHTIKGLEEVLG